MVKNLLDEAFKLISTIPVSQDNVEVMAAAKAKLRAAYAELNKQEELSKQEGTQNGG
jgi:hypothetical protein